MVGKAFLTPGTPTQFNTSYLARTVLPGSRQAARPEPSARMFLPVVNVLIPERDQARHHERPAARLPRWRARASSPGAHCRRASRTGPEIVTALSPEVPVPEGGKLGPVLLHPLRRASKRGDQGLPEIGQLVPRVRRGSRR